MGSPEFAVPILIALASQYELVGVITQPDRPAGRGNILTPPPIKLTAQSLGIPVFQPERLRRPEAFAVLEAWAPDLIIVAAFGQILRQNVLDLPKFGCINVHGSLLPRWRGAAPIQAAILNGDRTTGITIMKMDAGIDTGDILAKQSAPIEPDDNADTMIQKLSQIGAALLLETLPSYLDGTLIPVPQEHDQATYAPMIKKEDGLLDFSLEADYLARKVRAYTSSPGTYFLLNNQMIKVIQAHPTYQPGAVPAKHAVIDHFPAIGTGNGWLVLKTIQPSGKKPMSGADYLRGARNWLSQD